MHADTPLDEEKQCDNLMIYFLWDQKNIENRDKWEI